MASHLGLSKSPFFPKNISQYARLLQEVHADKIRIENERLQERIDRSKLVDELGMPFNYKKFLNGKVLNFKFVDGKISDRERIWPYGTLNQDEETVRIGWPSTFEIKLEGEQRAKKSLKRQLPVPKRKVDEEMAARLMNMGMMVETAVELLHAPEEMVGAMLKKALDACGLDEFALKRMEVDVINNEKNERQKWYTLPLEAESKEPENRYVEENVPFGGHKFDETELKNSGKWAELLNELNEM